MQQGEDFKILSSILQSQEFEDIEQLTLQHPLPSRWQLPFVSTGESYKWESIHVFLQAAIMCIHENFFDATREQKSTLKDALMLSACSSLCEQHSIFKAALLATREATIVLPTTNIDIVSYLTQVRTTLRHLHGVSQGYTEKKKLFFYFTLFLFLVFLGMIPKNRC